MLKTSVAGASVTLTEVESTAVIKAAARGDYPLIGSIIAAGALPYLARLMSVAGASARESVIVLLAHLSLGSLTHKIAVINSGVLPKFKEILLEAEGRFFYNKEQLVALALGNLLSRSSGRPAIRRAVIDAELFEPLLQMALKGKDWRSAHALSEFACDDATVSQALTSMGVVACMAHLLGSDQDRGEPKLFEMAARTLSRVAYAYPPARDELRARDAHQPLVQLLKHKDLTVREAAADALAGMACDHEANTTAIYGEEPFSSLSGLLRTEKAMGAEWLVEKAKASAALALGNIIYTSAYAAAGSGVNVSELLPLLRSRFSRTRWTAVYALSQLSCDSDKKTEMQEDAIFDQLWTLLSDSEATVREKLLNLFSKLVLGNTAAQEKFLAKGGATAVVGLLKEENVGVKSEGAWLITRITLNTFKMALDEQGVVEVLAEHLSHENARVRQSAVQAMSQLLLDCPELKARIVAKALPAVWVSLLGDPDFNTRTYTALAIGNFLETEVERVEMLEAGVIPSLLGLLAEEKEQRWMAAYALGELASTTPRCQIAVVTAGALPLLKPLLRHPVLRVREESLYSIRKLVADCPENKVAVIEAEMAPDLVACLGDDAKLHKSALQTIRHLVHECPANRHRLVEAGVMPSLIEFLNNPGAEIQEAAALALVDLSIDPKDSHDVYEAKGLAGLLTQFLSDELDLFRLHSIRAMTVFMREKPEQKAAVIDVGAVPLLVGLLQDADVTVKHAAAIAVAYLASTDSKAIVLAESASITNVVALLKEDEEMLKKLGLQILKDLVNFNEMVQSEMVTFGAVSVLISLSQETAFRVDATIILGGLNALIGQLLHEAGVVRQARGGEFETATTAAAASPPGLVEPAF